MGDRGYPSEHGKALGRELARLADSQVASHPEIPERCLTCGLREGTQANMTAATITEAMNCVVGFDQADFACHHGMTENGRPTKLCAGYLLCQAAPFEEVKAAVARAVASLNCLPLETIPDADFDAWRRAHDPDGRMDNYKQGREFEKWKRRNSPHHNGLPEGRG